ncbi:hypothetical protein BDF14DRAFT_1799155 [Spinellus fusiger]|nr:hypothetical protein BDF14DRAFT_1799155 [Spinellus fusiger]
MGQSERLDLRRTLIQQVQEKINSLQQEYSSLRQNLHEKGPLSHWVPPDRALVITSQTIGVSEYEANRDLEWARVREGSSLRTSANTSSTNTSASTSPEGVYSSYHYPTEAITPPQLTRPVVDPSPASRPNPLIQPLIPTEAVVSPSVGVTALAGHYQKPMENQIKARERRQQLTLPPLRPWQYNTALTL